MEKHRNNKKRRMLYMLISVGSNLGVLIFFKYTNFLLGNLFGLFGMTSPFAQIILPIGVSFNSFQSISYAIDVYRGTTSCEKKYYNYLAYTTLFPQIIAGPIVRYVTVENDLDDHMLTQDSFSMGMRRFIIGLGKKVLIANNVGLLWSQISSGAAGDPSVLLYWIGILAYTFQIYFDFSGYSDMAIGLARIFGLSFDENFNFPYISKSITEFWRRWHITLGSWFRDYVYIPLGGNRCSKLKHLRNLLKILDKIPAFFRHVYTMVLVMISWAIFYFEDLNQLKNYLLGMFGFHGIPLINYEGLYDLLSYGVIFAIAAYCSTPHMKKVVTYTEQTKKKWIYVCSTFVYIFVFFLCVAYLVDSTYNPFLYFRF